MLNNRVTLAELLQNFNDLDTKKAVNRVPGIRRIRAESTKIASAKTGDGQCEAYSNGYAVYDNGNRKTVVRIFDCANYKYEFNRLREKEKEYLNENTELDEKILKDSPWYLSVLLAGENRIQANMEHPKSTGTLSDYDLPEDYSREEWLGGARFGNPEEKLIQRETAEEARKLMRMLPDSHGEVFRLYYEYGYNQNEIARIIGITPKTVKERLSKARTEIVKIKEWLDKNFV